MKNKKYTKLVQLFMGLLLVASTLVGAIGGLEKVFAAEPDDATKVNVTLHKLQFNQSMTPVPNNGEKIPTELAAGEPLKDVEFTVYDVTAIYNELIKAEKDAKAEAEANPTDETKKAALAAATLAVTNAKAGKITLPTVEAELTMITKGKGSTGASMADPKSDKDAGDVTFTLDKKVDGKDAVYLFVETDSTKAKVNSGQGVETDEIIWKAAKVTSKAQNMLLVLPIDKVDGKSENRDIHLYPKNVTDEIKIEKSRVEYSHNYGEAINYTITGTLPLSLTETYKDGDTEKSVVKNFKFNDYYDKNLVFVEDKGIWYNNGTEDVELPTEGYTLTRKDTNFSFNVVINEKGIETLKAAKESINTNDETKKAEAMTFTFKYQMKIADTAPLDTELFNDVARQDTIKDGKVEIVVGKDSEGKDIIEKREPELPSTDGKTTDGSSSEIVDKNNPSETPQTITDEGNGVIVATGGYQLNKVDAADTTKLLSGAKFVLTRVVEVDESGEKKSVTQYLKDLATDTWVNAAANQDFAKLTDAKTFSSDANGLIEIAGIKNGKYSLVETKAPTNYVTPDTKTSVITFTVTAGKTHQTNEVAVEYTTDNTVAKGSTTEGAYVNASGDAVLSNSTTKEELAKKETGSYNKAKTELEKTPKTSTYLVKNTKKDSFLPSTGGKGVLMIAVVGISMMILGAVYFGRKFKKA